ISPIAIHPGITLKDTLDTLKMSQKELSHRTGLTEKTISQIINGKNPITLESSLKFERVLGVSKELWINLQIKYDQDKLRIESQKRLEDEIQFLKQYSCYHELAKLNYVKDTRRKNERVEELLRFFSVDSLKFVEDTYPVNFRITKHSNINVKSIIAWLRMGEIEAKDIKTKNFKKKKLNTCIPLLRKLTREDPRQYSSKLQDILAECGIILVYVPHLKNTYVNGATKWLSPNRALIQLSLRNKWSDIFWFTLFHELGHLYYGKKQPTIDYDGKQNSEEEEIADNFAMNNLINRYKYEEFFTNIDFKMLGTQIYKFANEIGVDVSIVAGRIGRDTNKWDLVRPYRSLLQFEK
ncbi:MAG: HigA family addiction module antidote protein, partial [Planctomycetia bacterium]|nr:HigA family addiction module antidote protein [Planctomycetia bacterium]